MSKKAVILWSFPLTVWLASASRVWVETEIETGGEGNVSSEVSASANGTKVEVKSQEQGNVKVQVQDGEVSVEKSEGVKPTIWITPWITPKVEEKNMAGESPNVNYNNRNVKVKDSLYLFLKELMLRLSRMLGFHF